MDIPNGSTITYLGIDYTTTSDITVAVIAPVDNSTVTATDTVPADPIIAPEAPQPSVEQVEIAPGETIEITEA